MFEYEVRGSLTMRSCNPTYPVSEAYAVTGGSKLGCLPDTPNVENTIQVLLQVLKNFQSRTFIYICIMFPYTQSLILRMS